MVTIRKQGDSHEKGKKIFNLADCTFDPDRTCWVSEQDVSFWKKRNRTWSLFCQLSNAGSADFAFFLNPFCSRIAHFLFQQPFWKIYCKKKYSQANWWSQYGKKESFWIRNQACFSTSKPCKGCINIILRPGGCARVITIAGNIYNIEYRTIDFVLQKRRENFEVLYSLFSVLCLKNHLKFQYIINLREGLSEWMCKNLILPKINPGSKILCPWHRPK